MDSMLKLVTIVTLVLSAGEVNADRLGKRSDSQLTTLRQRTITSFYAAEIQARAVVASSALEYAASILPNGTWADVQYHVNKSVDTRSIWPPSEHAVRVASMAQAFVAPSTNATNDTHLCTKTILGLQTWLDLNLSNPDNWYQNLISNPLIVGRTCLMLRTNLVADVERSSKLIEQCSTVMQRANWSAPPPAGMSVISGGNLVWMTTAGTYDGLLRSDVPTVHRALSRMYAELQISRGQGPGVKADGSFFQHDQPNGYHGVPLGTFGNLYSGGYGQSFTELILGWVAFTNKLPEFTPSNVSANLLSSLILDGQAWSQVGSVYAHWDTSVIGRELSRPNHSIAWSPAVFLELPSDFPRRSELVTFGKWLAQPNQTNSRSRGLGNKAFWKADYMVHRSSCVEDGDVYTVTMRGTSDRMLNTECIAHENEHGRHLGYGTQFLYLRGDEHENKYPLWDWQRLPGTTIEVDGDTMCAEYIGDNGSSWPPSNTSCWTNCYHSETTGTRDFVGGASTGDVGMFAIDHAERRSNLTYRMATVFLHGFHVVLHNGVHLPRSLNDVATTLLQSNVGGDVFVGNSDIAPTNSTIKPLIPGTHQYRCESGVWIHHSQGGVVVLNATSVTHLTVEANVNVSQDWSSIGVENGTVTGSTLSAFASYDKQPKVAVTNTASSSSTSSSSRFTSATSDRTSDVILSDVEGGAMVTLSVPGISRTSFAPQDWVSSVMVMANTRDVIALLVPNVCGPQFRKHVGDTMRTHPRNSIKNNNTFPNNQTTDAISTNKSLLTIKPLPINTEAQAATPCDVMLLAVTFFGPSMVLVPAQPHWALPLRLTVSEACVCLFERPHLGHRVINTNTDLSTTNNSSGGSSSSSNSVTLTLSDPTQKLKQLDVTIEGVDVQQCRTLSNIQTPPPLSPPPPRIQLLDFVAMTTTSPPSITVRVHLPLGEFAGSSVKMLCTS
eukprot:m.194436 g.194436  ORF g.194436 m.194436 type:complete len:950 (-) comp32528_c1_seq1:76-2925(-)